MIKCNAISATKNGVFLCFSDSKNLFIRYAENDEKKISFNTENQKDKKEKLYLNIIQRQMYRRIMYGLNEYSEEQLKTFSAYTISKIEEDYKKGKRIIHVLKAKKLYKAETMLINALFPNFNIGEKEHDWYLEIPKTVTLRSLGISTKEVIENFIDKNLLPKNFFNLTPENVKL